MCTQQGSRAENRAGFPQSGSDRGKTCSRSSFRRTIEAVLRRAQTQLRTTPLSVVLTFTERIYPLSAHRCLRRACDSTHAVDQIAVYTLSRDCVLSGLKSEIDSEVHSNMR